MLVILTALISSIATMIYIKKYGNNIIYKEIGIFKID